MSLVEVCLGDLVSASVVFQIESLDPSDIFSLCHLVLRRFSCLLCHRLVFLLLCRPLVRCHASSVLKVHESTSTLSHVKSCSWQAGQNSGAQTSAHGLYLSVSIRFNVVIH